MAHSASGCLQDVSCALGGPVAVFPVSRALYVFTDQLLSACSLAPKVLLMFFFSTTVLYLVPKTHVDFSCLETLSQ